MAVTSMALSSIVNFARGNKMSGPKQAGIPWAEISGGTQTTATIDGVEYQINKFTSNGTLTVAKEGYVDFLVVGGGAAARTLNSRNAGGGGGGVIYGLAFVSAGSEAITIGAGGSGTNANTSNPGSASSFGSIRTAAGGWRCLAEPNVLTTSVALAGGWGPSSPGGIMRWPGGNHANGGGAGGSPSAVNGLTLNYDGTSREYGRGGDSSTAPVTNQGWGAPPTSDGRAGSSGVVVVRVAL